MKTLLLDPQFFQTYDFAVNSTFFTAFRLLVRNKKVKGLVVGYPLTQKNEMSKQCEFVERFVEHMWEKEKIKTPITLVNEYMSTWEAKARIAEMVQGQGVKMLEEALAQKREFIHSGLLENTLNKAVSSVVPNNQMAL